MIGEERRAYLPRCVCVRKPVLVAAGRRHEFYAKKSHEFLEGLATKKTVSGHFFCTCVRALKETKRGK